MGNYNRFYPAKKYRYTVHKLSEIKQMLLNRRDNQKDNIIIVTGSRGEGKSTLVGKILFQFEDFNPWESIVYTKEGMFKQVKKKFNYVWGDEAIISTSKGNTMTRANKLLHELFTISRSNFNIIFLIIPSIEDFDSKILQYCSMWLYIDRRGRAVVMLPTNKGIFGKKSWDIDGMKKLYEDVIKERKGESEYIPYYIFSNFRGYIRFGKLTKEQEQIITEIKDLRKNENLDKEMQEQVTIEVKEAEQTQKYVAKKLSELVIKGEIRSIEQFNKTCEEYKLNSEELIKKCDSILKRNNFGTIKGKLREYKKEDELIKFKV